MESEREQLGGDWYGRNPDWPYGLRDLVERTEEGGRETGVEQSIDVSEASDAK